MDASDLFLGSAVNAAICKRIENFNYLFDFIIRVSDLRESRTGGMHA